MQTIFKSFPDRHYMTDNLAAVIAELLTTAIAKRGKASLVVSGGSTPKQLFYKLSERQLPWDQVTITLADERWVEPTNELSNEQLVRSSLLINNASVATFVGLKTNHNKPEEAEISCESALGSVPTPFDIVLLGMGDDGHTASLFPQADTLDEALDMESRRSVLAIEPVELPEHAPFPRISMTLPRLLDSRCVFLLIAGENKLGVYNLALSGNDIMQMPVRAVLKQNRTPVTVYWSM